MNHYDIEKIYDDLEKYLIRNIKRNLTDDLKSFHIKEEKDYGFDWEAWQSIKLRELKRYRRQNKEIINKKLKNIDKKIAEVLQRETQQGKLDAFRNFKEAMANGYKSNISVKDTFFRLNDRKIDKLVNSVTNDFKTANKAVLRKSDDVYRQIIFEASMYNQSGVMTERQAIRKAIDDFTQRGINCIEYSNGARHTISNYTKMAIRTASTRAYLQGEGELRKKIGETLVLMSKHNTACELCQPWEGKILIDDVYSGGTKKDGKYPLLSEAMKQGLYHPNCRHGHGTYYKELGKDTSNKIIEKVEEEKDNQRKRGQLPEMGWREQVDSTVQDLNVDKGRAEAIVTSLREYTRSGYVQIREKTLQADWIVKQREDIEEYIEKAPKYEGKIFRGLKMDNSEFIDSLAIGNELDMGGISSWTSSYDIAKHFADKKEAPYRVILEMENKSGVGIAHLSAYGREQEVIQSSKVKYSIKQIETIKEETASYIKVILEEIE